MAITPALSDQDRRARRIGGAGWFVLALSVGAAALPWAGPRHGAGIIGIMLGLAGVAEIVAGAVRHETRRLAMLAGAVTVAAGLLFWTDAATQLLPAAYIIMGWLVLRGAILLTACFLERGSVRRWTGVAAATDLALAMFLLLGLSIATLVVTLFGETPPLVASFAWIVAISFISTGLLLLEVASCAREGDV